jgi:hypothetical protein
MDERCLAIVTKALEDRPGWPLVICGHSLGAGTGSLLGMRWRGKGLFPGFKVNAFATPPTVDCCVCLCVCVVCIHMYAYII